MNKINLTLQGAENLQKQLKKLVRNAGNAKQVTVGFLADTEHSCAAATLAATQEYGRAQQNILPRPLFRATISQEKGRWSKKMGRRLKENFFDAKVTLANMGDEMGDDIGEGMQATLATLAESIRKEGDSDSDRNSDWNSDRTSIVNSTLLNHINSEVS